MKASALQLSHAVFYKISRDASRNNDTRGSASLQSLAIYFIKMKNWTKNLANFLLPTGLVMSTYYVWYRFTYFNQTEPISSETQLL